MLKNINELTLDEAKQIFKFVFPDDTVGWVRGISFEPVILEDGSQQLTLGFNPIIGIEYHNGQDNCILHFNHSKVVLWLYKNGYDILELLEDNSYFTEMEQDFDTFAFAIHQMSKGASIISDEYKHNWTLERVEKKCHELVEKYWFKDYK